MRIDIRSGNLFPPHFLVLAVLLLCAGGLLLLRHSFWSVPLLLLGAGMLTASEGTEIDTLKATVREYNSFFFVRTGAARKYAALERIYIKPGQVSQRLNSAHTASGSTFRYQEYKVFLRYAGGDPVLLFSGKRHPHVLTRSRALAAQLGVPLLDHSQ